MKTHREVVSAKREEEELLEGKVYRSKSSQKIYNLDYLVGVWSPTRRTVRKPINK